MKILWAERALTGLGWQRNVRLEVDETGRILTVQAGVQPIGERFGMLLPAPANLHSHAFQRAMAGLTEARGPDPADSFWTWRKLMYRFLNHLTPDDVEAIAAYAQMEMLEAGFASVGEFHYLHHQANGQPYAATAEMSQRIAAAADSSGIGLTLLPVFYEHGGCDGRSLTAAQVRFGNSIDQFLRLHSDAGVALNHLPSDTSLGVAPHSLRAVSQKGLDQVVELAANNPLHIHVAEQVAEVEEVKHAWGARPVEWLLGTQKLAHNWCLVHATQMQPFETEALAATGAVAGLCPITESNLGDGIFDGARFIAEGGIWGVGTDSNIRISFTGELRTLEYSQRLRDRARAVLATPTHSTGRVLFDGALKGGAQALQRQSGCIEVGRLADLLTIDSEATAFVAATDDTVLDALIFAGDDHLVSNVWSAGRHVVKEGRHIHHDAIRARYRSTLSHIAAQL